MNAYDIVKPALFSLPAETAHGLVHSLLGVAGETPLARALADRYVVDDDRLAVEAFDCPFDNPVGVAAGFDKNAEVVPALATLGFGSVEVGGVTARPQTGNPRPRVFRLREDRALVNRMGFNNDGADAVGPRVARETDTVPVPVGVNIGKSKSTPIEDAPEDYRYTYERVAAADYFVVNVSSPNTPGLRELQQRDRLERILGRLRDAGVLVEARGHADRVREPLAERRHRESVVVDGVPLSQRARHRGVLNGRQSAVDDTVGRLRRQAKQERFRRVVQVHYPYREGSVRINFAKPPLSLPEDTATVPDRVRTRVRPRLCLLSE